MREIRFNPGDKLQIRSHKSDPGKGLSYPARIITAYDPGVVGGWDVYEGRTARGRETYFYGFSVVQKVV